MIEIIGMLCSKDNFLRVSTEAIEPSSGSTIAERTETGCNLARITKSTEASVWPALLKTPPFRYLRGKTCPGLLKSSGLELGDERAKTVFALSAADTPVNVPDFAS